VINIITRRPGVGAAAFRTEAGATGSLTVPGAGLGVRLTQAVQGSVGAMDYVASGTFGQTGSYYDAEGDLIPADPHGQGGVADTRSWDLFAKAGYSRGTRRVQLSANLYRSDQDTEHTADISVNTLPPGTSKARALRGLREWEPQGTRNLNVSVDYSDGGFLGGRLHAQAWGRDYVTRFRGFDRRVIRNGEWLSGHVGQSFVDSEKWGGRLEVEQPLRLAEGTLLLGADYTLENTAQLMTIMDPAVYDGSGGLVFEKVGERVWVPALRPHDLGLFAQIGWQVSGRLLTRAGVRWERIRMRVDDFTTIDDARVTGGNVAYDPVLFNAGAVFEATGWLDVFASFAQGFSLADVGRILRGASDGFAVRNSTLEAPRVDHLEAGVRGEWGGSVRGSLAVFRSESELGTRLVADALGVLRVERAPERIYGVEAALDARRGSWAFGGTVSWTEGEYREGRTGAWLPFDGYRIQPLKATGYLGHATAGGWTNRLQALYSGSRDRVWRELGRPDRTTLGYGQWPVERHAVVDFRSRRPLGPGHLEVGIENLLNRRYFDVLSQLDLSEGNAYHTAGRGRTLSVGYAVAY
jgi:iron complex outermembrane receptor protein